MYILSTHPGLKFGNLLILTCLKYKISIPFKKLDAIEIGLECEIYYNVFYIAHPINSKGTLEISSVLFCWLY